MVASAPAKTIISPLINKSIELTARLLQGAAPNVSRLRFTKPVAISFDPGI